MVKKKENISIIIPIYNSSASISSAIRCLKNQSFPFKKMEIILIDDGSEDESLENCNNIARWHNNVHVLHQENKGVSAARNLGLRKAKGKYIFFLDADDELSSETIQNCVDFFDSIGDAVDLVTYPIETIYRGKVLAPHFRYQFLKQSGIYDLCDNAFIGQTTMNVVVRNRFEENILFDEGLNFSEDQKYCCDVLAEKLKIGFCKDAKYIYYRSEESSSGRLAGACYIFEKSLNFFEEIFSRYEYVPMAFQGLFVNDIAWKMASNIFFPYHYDKEKYVESMERVKALLQKCYNSVILDHPAIDYFEKHYLMRLKGKQYITPHLFQDAIGLYSEGYLVYHQKSLEAVITRVKIKGKQISISGFLKSVFFQYYDDAIELLAIENKETRKQLELTGSAHNYYLSHEDTQRFWKFKYECDVDYVKELALEVSLGELTLPVHYYFMLMIPFSEKYNDYLYSKDMASIRFDNNMWHFDSIEEINQPPIWLYYDCRGVALDNGLMQYLHDYNIADGVQRYYIVSDDSQKQHLPVGANCVGFGTHEHLMLVLRADKIITAFIENNNIFPNLKSDYDYERYANLFQFDVIYLQHGILHIDMPWKYSPEKIIADKVVVSAEHEAELFKKNGFDEEDLWRVGMPRFDLLDSEVEGKTSDKKKIMFALSWRPYLVGENENGVWKPLEKKFISSNYYKGVKEFLESERLAVFCREYGYSIDVKLHPIFSCYGELIKVEREYLTYIKEANVSDYDLLITDFSSYMFDYIYTNIPVLSYIPDMDEFLCGMNGYRKADFVGKVDKKYLCSNTSEILDRLFEFAITGQGMDYKVNFYIDQKKKESRDKIYHLITQM